MKGMGKSKILWLLNLSLLLTVSDGRAQWTRVYSSGNADGNGDAVSGMLETFRHTLLYYAGDSTGMMASADEGKTWTPENAGLRLGAVSNGYYFHFCRALESVGGDLFASIEGDSAGLYLSENAGANWKPLPWSGGQWVGSTSAVASDGDVYYALTYMGDLYSFRTNDSGSISHTNIPYGDSPIPGLPSSGSHPAFSDLLIRNGVFVANTWMTGSLLGGVLLSRDSGKTWAYGSLKDTAVYAIAGNDEFIFAATDRGIYRSPDDGATWDLLKNNVFADTGNTGRYHTYSIYVRGKDIFAASYRLAPNGGGWTDPDVYFSEDNGSSWEAIATGKFPDQSYVSSIAMSDSSVFVVVGKDLWKRPWKDLSTGIRPFGPGAGKAGLLFGDGGVLRGGDRLDFIVGKKGWVDIGLFDGKGKRLRTLAGSEMAAGRHSVRFSPDLGISGRFYLRLRTGATSEAVQVIVRN